MTIGLLVLCAFAAGVSLVASGLRHDPIDELQVAEGSLLCAAAVVAVLTIGVLVRMRHRGYRTRGGMHCDDGGR